MENFVKFGHGSCGCLICEPADRQTDNHTDARIAILCSPTESDVINLLRCCVT